MMEELQLLNLTTYENIDEHHKIIRETTNFPSHDGIYLVPVGLNAIEKAAVISSIAS